MTLGIITLKLGAGPQAVKQQIRTRLSSDVEVLPTAALDSKSGRDVVEIMQWLAKQQGCTILLVTHDTRILDIADRLIHMEDGRLAQDTALVGSVT